MSEAKRLLNSLLWDIYGRQRREHTRTRRFDKYSGKFREDDPDMYDYGTLKFANSAKDLENFSIRRLIDISAILKVEISLMGRFLERVLISRERNRRHQDALCSYVDALLYLQYRLKLLEANLTAPLYQLSNIKYRVKTAQTPQLSFIGFNVRAFTIGILTSRKPFSYFERLLPSTCLESGKSHSDNFYLGARRRKKTGEALTANAPPPPTPTPQQLKAVNKTYYNNNTHAVKG